MSGFIDRIQYFMSQMGINNNQMTVIAGLSVGLIGKAIKLKAGLNSDSIEKILCAYPDLNPTWLLTGKGEMLISNNSENKNAYPNAYLSDKISINSENKNDKVNNKNGNLNGNPNGNLSKKKTYLPPSSTASTSIAAEPSSQYGASPESMQLIKMLMDKINEKDAKLDAKEAKIDHLSQELAETQKELAVIKTQLSDYQTYTEELLRQLEAGAPGGKTSAKNATIKKRSSQDADNAKSASVL